jgi:hypothetical protein
MELVVDKLLRLLAEIVVHAFEFEVHMATSSENYTNNIGRLSAGVNEMEKFAAVL